MSHVFLEVASPGCSAEDFDGEIVAINLDTGVYFNLRDSAVAIWHDLADGHAVETVLGLGSDDTALAASIERFVGDLKDSGLMRTRSAPGTPTSALRSTRGMVPPVLESFGDMQSLLLLDPVHEVDEQVGWPKPRDE